MTAAIMTGVFLALVLPIRPVASMPELPNMCGLEKCVEPGHELNLLQVTASAKAKAKSLQDQEPGHGAHDDECPGGGDGYTLKGEGSWGVHYGEDLTHGNSPQPVASWESRLFYNAEDVAKCAEQCRDLAPQKWENTGADTDTPYACVAVSFNTLMGECRAFNKNRGEWYTTTPEEVMDHSCSYEMTTKPKAPHCDEDGTCFVFGDPHIAGFDQPSVSPDALKSLVQMDIGYPGEPSVPAGNYWLVKSDLVQVQGHYEHVYYPKAVKADGTDQQVYMTAVAVGGPFLQGSTLVIEPRNGKMMWNQAEILASMSSTFEDGSLIQAKYSNDTAFVNDPQKHAPGVDAKLPSGVKLTVNRFGKHLGLALTMARSAVGQKNVDGQCGNFNCNANDDMATLIEQRMDLLVAEDDLLYKK